MCSLVLISEFILALQSALHKGMLTTANAIKLQADKTIKQDKYSNVYKYDTMKQEKMKKEKQDRNKRKQIA